VTFARPLAAMSYVRYSLTAFLMQITACPLLAQHGATAQGPSPEFVARKITPSQLLHLMRREGYDVELVDDGSIAWKNDGYRTWLHTSAEGACLRFSIGFKGKGEVSLQRVNKWNRRGSFSRSYLDDEGDPHLVLEIELEGGVTVARLLDWLVTCRCVFRIWRDEVLP